MDYITSRPYELPKDAAELQASFFFNLWSRQLWPYNQLEIRDILYWYYSPARRIVWKSQTLDVDRFVYPDKEALRSKLEQRFGVFDAKQPYFDRAIETGFCLAYRVKALQRLNLPKPEDIWFPRLGWLKADTPKVLQWLSGQ